MLETANRLVLGLSLRNGRCHSTLYTESPYARQNLGMTNFQSTCGRSA